MNQQITTKCLWFYREIRSSGLEHRSGSSGLEHRSGSSGICGMCRVVGYIWRIYRNRNIVYLVLAEKSFTVFCRTRKGCVINWTQMMEVLNFGTITAIKIQRALINDDGVRHIFINFTNMLSKAKLIQCSVISMRDKDFWERCKQYIFPNNI